MSEHAFLPPSGAHVWVVCAAAPKMWRLYPEPPDSIESMEGTAAHWVFAEMLADRPVDIGSMAPNGIIVTDQMMDGAGMYVEVLDETLETVGLTRDWLQIEQRVQIANVHPENWGTPDTFLNALVFNKTLYLFEYKFGHAFVDEFQNWQTIDYVAGILNELGVDGFEDQVTNVVTTIVQPRNYHRDGPVRRHTYRAVDLRGWINILRVKAEEACGPDPRYTVNPGCEHCSGRHACEPYQHAALNAVVHSKRSTPLDLPVEAIGLELTILKQAKAALDGRITGLEESVFAGVQRGVSVPGWHIEHTDGREVFNRPDTEMFVLGDLYAVDLRKKGTITPKQAIKAGIPESVVKGLTLPTRGAPKLVPDNINEIRKVFSK